MKVEVKRIDIWPVIKIVFVLSLLLGFFIGVLYGGLFLLMDAFSQVAFESGFDEFGSFGAGFILFFIFGFTFGIAILNTIGAVIFVVLYNLLAGSFGGFRVDLESLETHQKESISVG
jgi:hypothetical protein